ncbi:hypothetical protein [Paenarthrobacter nicotinovorans]|uniref:hypothetical protein n=1 Tax=Paenarthrobacter nicotinovorans TaxID=29320 RepID=UPI003747A173
MAEHANKFRGVEIDELEFIENSELLALDAAVSTRPSFASPALIPRWRSFARVVTSGP